MFEYGTLHDNGHSGVALRNGEIHVCACLARLLSNGIGSTALLSRSFSMSMRSTPEEPPWELSQSLAALPPYVLEVNDGTADVFTLDPGSGGDMEMRL